LFIDGGAGTLVDFLASHLEGAIVLNAPVSDLAQDAEGVTVAGAAGAFRGRRAIVAVPPQTYPMLGLTPELPEDRLKVLSDFQLGRVYKTVIEFDSPWWREDGLSGAIVNPGDTFHAVVDGTPAGSTTGVLVAFTSGPGADELGATTPSEEARIAAFAAWLSRVNGRDLPPVIGGRSYDWNGDAYSQGGYASRRGIGGWAAVPDLFAPWQHVHFAGTETADLWRSYMDGAIQSGLRAADEVAARLVR